MKKNSIVSLADYAILHVHAVHLTGGTGEGSGGSNEGGEGEEPVYMYPDPKEPESSLLRFIG